METVMAWACRMWLVLQHLSFKGLLWPMPAFPTLDLSLNQVAGLEMLRSWLDIISYAQLQSLINCLNGLLYLFEKSPAVCRVCWIFRVDQFIESFINLVAVRFLEQLFMSRLWLLTRYFLYFLQCINSLKIENDNFLVTRHIKQASIGIGILSIYVAGLLLS